MSQSLPDMVLRERGNRLPDRQPEQAMRRTRRQTAIALARVPMFADFSKRHLERLSKDTDELVFEPGQIIVKEGDLGETLFVVLEGSAKVVRAKKRVGEVVPGDFFGELSTIDGGPRTATVVAETPMRVLRLFRRTLDALIRDEPQVTLKLLDGIVRRFRQVERRANTGG
jgi:CRP/FNR family transcriptional regulator, cyclic AMP receptor protein